MPTREHQRAQHALQAVRVLQEEKWAPRYRSYVDRLGPAILRNGLGQALAGELAAAGSESGESEAHRRLYANLESWLCGKERPYPAAPLLDALVKGEEDEYLRAHAEAMAWLEWHKRFCRAYIPRESAAGTGEG
ncbi:MAG TPA: type III-B CRISPR module-associated protein Cmr5 [Thermoanaerobaculia bacterium]|jgi:CRISPR-associated protein Cmr5